MSVRSLRHLFEPERLLWVGPSGPSARWVELAENHLWEAGFKGRIHAWRSRSRAPEAARIESPAALAGKAFLGIVCLPQDDLVRLLHDLAAAGCRAMVIVGGGSETMAIAGEQAKALRVAARRLGVRVVGPDRVGVLVPSLGLNAGSAVTLPQAGNLAFVTQSDSIATTMLDWAGAHGIGFSRVVSLGDSADVELGDILDYLALDLATRAIMVHLEGIADARPFMSAARAAAGAKPVIVIKAGRQLAPPAMRSQVRGHRLHRDRVYAAAFNRAGLVRVDTLDELFAAAASLGTNAVRRGPELRNGRLAILTNGNAPAEFAADMLLARGGVLVRPTAEIHARIRAAVGETASHASSIDLGLEADGTAYARALDVVLDTPGIDGVLVIHAPAAGIDPAEVARAVATTADRRRPRSMRRPLLAAWLGETGLEQARAPLEAAAIPAFGTPEAAVRAFLHRVGYERSQFLLHQVPSSRLDDVAPRQAAAMAVIEPALARSRHALGEADAAAVLGAYGIPCVPTAVAGDLDAAAAAARALGYPVALKVLSAKLPRKSPVGGVALDISDKASLRRRGRQMLDRVAAAAPGATIDGLLVQRMERSLLAIELYLGMEIDPTFGPVLLLGHAARRAIGSDLTYLLPPLDATLARALIEDTAVGRHVRQLPNAEALFGQLLDILVRLSDLVVTLPAVRRIVIEPLLVSEQRLVVLDASIDLSPVTVGDDPGVRLAIRPYPRELEQTAKLRDGREIRLRPIRPEDAPALKQLFDALTPEDRRRRLFASMRELPAELAARLCQVDYDREIVLVALSPDQPEQFWGGARIAADADNQRAEYSVTIRSDKQGLGLGRICFERALDYARRRGIREVWGSVLAENEGMLGLADRLGFARRRDPDSPDIVITEKRLH